MGSNFSLVRQPNWEFPELSPNALSAVEAGPGTGSKPNAAFYEVHGVKTPEQQAQAVMASIVGRYDPDQGINIAMENDGCVFANDELRQDFQSGSRG